ncbi:MAG: autotransporter outer membrane beta-barrel domain-containing protein [Planctomycetes bacterium]|nr:autotransporter outer membrane beta-barrel domain-containing protein [Planctomycetota bacterium]MBL7044915.1 autotransporter outer membrane beta-barrel domain-containing protein [Pirellulaceae bacterium]
MSRFGSVLLVTTTAVVCLLAGTTVGHAAMDPGGGPPPPPPPPASSSGQMFGSSAQAAIQGTVYQFEMLTQRIREAGAGDEFGLAAMNPGVYRPNAEYDGLQWAGTGDGSQPVVRAQNFSVIRGDWDAWFSAYDIGGNVEATAAADGLDYAASGAQLGLYRLLDIDTVFGVFGGYAHQNVDVITASNTGNVDNGQVGMFLRRSDTCKYWVLVGSVAYDSYYSARTTPTGTAVGDYDGSQASLYVERGWSLWGTSVGLEPSIALQYVWLHQNDFAETGAGVNNLTYTEANTDSLRTIIGARFKREHSVSWGILTPELRAHWMHEYLDDTTSVIITAAGPPATSTGVSLGRDWGMLGGGFTLNIGGDVSLFANYDLQLNNRTALHLASGGAQWEW